MRIKTLTIAEAKAARESWRRKFALFPVRVADGEWRWLEFVERRELSTVSHFVRAFTVQHRAPGAVDFYPPYPWLVGDGRNRICNQDFEVEQRRSNRDRPEFPKSEIIKDHRAS